MVSDLISLIEFFWQNYLYLPQFKMVTSSGIIKKLWKLNWDNYNLLYVVVWCIMNLNL